MAFTNISGINIHYEIAGNGPALLMFAPGGWRSVMTRWTASGGKEAWKEMKIYNMADVSATEELFLKLSEFDKTIPTTDALRAYQAAKKK